MPLATIGVSFLNPGVQLQQTVQSVFAQSITDWELLLIDDGSTDSSVNWAKKIDDPRVKVLYDERSQGLNRRLNQLVHSARGDYFFRLDSDDIMSPCRLAILLEHMEKSSENEVFGSSVITIDENASPCGFQKSYPRFAPGISSWRSFFHTTVAARTSWFRQNPYSEHPVYWRSQDAELWVRTSPFTTFTNLENALVYYRTSNSTSLKNYAGTTAAFINILKDYSKSKREFLYWSTRQLFKLWVYCFFNSLGLEKHLAKTRENHLTPQQQQKASQEINAVLSTEIPAPDINGFINNA